MIQYQVDLNLRIKDRNSLQRFFVMDLGNKNTVILGHPWLTKTNPLIDWTAGTVRMRGTPVPRHDDPRILEQRYLLQYLHAMEKDNSELAARIYAQQRNAATLLRVLGKDHPPSESSLSLQPWPKPPKEWNRNFPHSMPSMSKSSMSQREGSFPLKGPLTME